MTTFVRFHHPARSGEERGAEVWINPDRILYFEVYPATATALAESMDAEPPPNPATVIVLEGEVTVSDVELGATRQRLHRPNEVIVEGDPADVAGTLRSSTPARVR